MPSLREDTSKEDFIRVGDRIMTIFDPQYHIVEDGYKVMSRYNATISNPLQFDYVMPLFAPGLSFRQITLVELHNREHLCSVSKAGLFLM